MTTTLEKSKENAMVLEMRGWDAEDGNAGCALCKVCGWVGIEDGSWDRETGRPGTGRWRDTEIMGRDATIKAVGSNGP